jgi:hypothetical protein
MIGAELERHFSFNHHSPVVWPTGFNAAPFACALQHDLLRLSG